MPTRSTVQVWTPSVVKLALSRPQGYDWGMTPIEKDPARGLNAAIAAELRAERAASRMSFDELAERTGISKRTLLRLLNGERAVTMAYLETICEELGVTMSAIAARAEARMSEERFILAASSEDVDSEVEEWQEP